MSRDFTLGDRVTMLAVELGMRLSPWQFGYLAAVYEAKSGDEAPVKASLTPAPPQPTPACPADAPRTTAPRGRVIWVCSTPAGRTDCAHPDEREAEECGKTVWWPVTIDNEGAA